MSVNFECIFTEKEAMAAYFEENPATFQADMDKVQMVKGLDGVTFTPSVSANWLSIALLQVQSWRVNLLVIKSLSIIPHPPYPIPESISITAHIL